MPNNKKVKIKIASNAYGKVILRPANDLALKLTKLTRNRSLTEADIEIIISLGFEMEFV